MNKIEIKNNLNQPYNRENWKKLSKEIFENVEFFKEPLKIESPNEKVLEFLQIGNLKLKGEKKIALFEIKLIKNLNIYKNKVELRNLVIDYIDQVSNHGVMVVYDNQGENYRLTFSTKYSEINNQGQLINIETEAKRFTYLLGQTESCSTAADRFHFLSNKKSNLSVDDIIEAFNVEKVSKEFFDSYKTLCFEIENELKSLRKKDKKINKDFEKNNLDELNFSKKLLGQIVFIYFLQKKGWLGIKKNSYGDFINWGSGDKIFFKNLFEGKYRKYKNFFNDILEPLFYEGLGSERKDDVLSSLNCKIPFLNGGLFEPIKNYDWSQTDITLSNEIFKKIIETFDRYNFTIQEEDPEDKEVAIDPEMLGKVFENLLPENARKKGGSFYTPRAIVNHMCEESIFNYLKNNFVNKLNEEILYEFVKSSKSPKKILNKEIIKNAENIDELLKRVKICDPAIGSGAFPVSMMNLIVQLRLSIAEYSSRKYKNSNYYFKKDCIQNSIYGVDIEESAIDIAKLRLWLSLIVDEDDYEKIEPLPNLDFKIIQGNSLIETFENIKISDSIFEYSKTENLEDFIGNSSTIEMINELAKLQSTFFQTISHSKKQKLKKEIEQKIVKIFETNISSREKFSNNQLKDLQEKLKKIISGQEIKNFFPWKIFFSEVFSINKGFDIIIGNPPYVNIKDVSKLDWKDDLNNNFGFLDDLYNHFMFLSFLITKEGGIVSFITSDTFMTLQSKKNLRDKILNHKIISLAPTPKSFSAMVDTCIITYQNKKTDQDYYFNFLDLKEIQNDNLVTLNSDKPNWESILNYIFQISLNKKMISVSSKLYKNNLNSVFFNPSEKNLKIFKKITSGAKKVYDKYWEAIKTSKAISENKSFLESYNHNLKDGDLTLLGLITNGGQGMATGNNGDYVGCIENSKEAFRVKKNRPGKLLQVIKNNRKSLIKKNDLLSDIMTLKDAVNFLNSIDEQKIREIFKDLKKEFGRDIFGQGFLYKIISKNEIIDENKISQIEKTSGIKNSKKIYVKYDKGDKDGNRWFFTTPYYIKWDTETVNWFMSNSGRSGVGMPVIRNKDFFFKSGFCWSDVHTTYLRCRLKEKSIYDVKSMSLFNINPKISDKFLVCLINSKFISEFQQDFLNNTSSFQINDARKIPIIIPDKATLAKFDNLYDEAKKIKDNFFKNIITEDEHYKKLNFIESQNDLLVEKLYGI